MSKQITTFSIFTFNTFKDKLWAFKMMQFAHGSLKRQNGLVFYKLLGTGKTGFNPSPDWSTYCILQVWEDEAAAQLFFYNSELFQKYRSHTKSHLVLFLKNILCRGEWSGGNPFVKHADIDEKNPYLAVLTRATIKTKLLFKFWRFVPESQKRLLENDGLIYTKGVGEVPFKQMATFSIWKDKAALNSFAYRANGHVEAIKKTRDLNWYNEELFSRFQPYQYLGSLEGVELPQNFSLEKM